MTELALHDPRDPRVAEIWRALEITSAPSYVLSWGWIENWLASLPAGDAPSLAVLRDDAGTPIAAYLLGHRHIRHHGVVPSNAFYLNACGDGRHDDPALEHNGVLRVPGAQVTLDTLIEHLPPAWDELVLPAVDLTAFPELGRLGCSRRYRVRVDREASAPVVDLDTVRAAAGGYLAVVAPASRARIRRARDVAGELAIEVAGDVAHAIDIYGELLRLHARRHHERGRSGAFADPWFERLHRRLIETRFAHREIQLIRVSAAGATLGCLYNLVYRGRVLAYQSGFAGHRPAPSDLCHAAAIAHNAAACATSYELTTGDPRHRGLATGETRLAWLRVQRRLARFALEDRVVGWTHDLAARIGRHGAGVPSRA